MARIGIAELIVIVVAVIVVLVGLSTRRGGTFPGRLDRLERKVDLILDHLGINPTPPMPEGVAELLARGRTIEAIRLYRERTGVGLKEAKDAVDRFQEMAAKPARPDEV